MHRRRRLGFVLVAALTTCAACGEHESAPRTLTAEQQVLADAIVSRRYKMKELDVELKNLRDGVSSENPDRHAMAFGAKTVRSHSRGQLDWFPEGSGPELGIETLAKPEIWQNWADFEAAADDFEAVSDELATVMGDPDATPAERSAQVKATMASCNSCHARFRKRVVPGKEVER